MEIAAFIILIIAQLMALASFDFNQTELRHYASATGLLAIVTFFSANHLTLLTTIVLCLFISLSWAQQFITHQILNKFVVICIASSALIIALHIIPGIDHILITKERLISKNSQPVTLWVHFDKGLAGLALLLIAIKQDTHSAVKTWLHIPLVVISILTAGWMLGLNVDLKFPDFTLTFLLSNLFLTVIAEEVFFRGLIQNELVRLLNKYKYKTATSILITAVLFGMTHAGGGWNYILLATLAGLGYGYIYASTGRLTAAITAHFLVNAGHFLFLSYPVPH